MVGAVGGRGGCEDRVRTGKERGRKVGGGMALIPGRIFHRTVTLWLRAGLGVQSLRALRCIRVGIGSRLVLPSVRIFSKDCVFVGHLPILFQPEVLLEGCWE